MLRRTAAARPASLAAVALLAGARQRRFGSRLQGTGLEGRWRIRRPFAGAPATAYSPRPHGRGRTEASVAARAPLYEGLVLPVSGRSSTAVDCLQCTRTAGGRGRGDVTITRSGRWRSYGFIRPVLKHGPRSLACARVFGCGKPAGAMKVKARLARAEARTRRVFAAGASSTDPTYAVGRFE